jgi:hypothetical protein
MTPNPTPKMWTLCAEAKPEAGREIEFYVIYNGRPTLRKHTWVSVDEWISYDFCWRYTDVDPIDTSAERVESKGENQHVEDKDKILEIAVELAKAMIASNGGFLASSVIADAKEMYAKIYDFNPA